MSKMVKGTFSAVLLCLWALFPTNGVAELRVTKVVTDGRDKTLSFSSDTEKRGTREQLSVPSSTKNVVFNFERPRSVGEAVRLKYRMEGIDSNWRDLKSHFLVRFYAIDSTRLIDGTGRVVSGDVAMVSGESPGWKGSADAAPLVPFSMSITVPRHANGFKVHLVSNSPTPALGQWVVADVKLRVLHKDGALPVEVAVECPPESKANIQALDTTPWKWSIDGVRPDLAQVLLRTTPPPERVLYLNDTDPNKYTAWRSHDIMIPSLAEGDQATLECQMAYSIGSGTVAGLAEYQQMEPGSYRFRVAAFQVNGLPTGEEVSFPVIVEPPLYQRTDFWLALVVACGALLLLVTRLVLWGRMRRQLEQSERRQLVELERTRIARDIHDDLGATLAQIAMLSEIARTDAGAKPEENLKTFNDIFSLAYESTQKLNEIIWAINPANDTLEHVVRYLCRFAEHHLKLAGLRFRLEAPEKMPPYILSSAQRHNLFLAAKEAIHNAVKYAAASEVTLHIRIEEDVLHLCVEDNGKGFVEGTDVPKGHGCVNMKQRLEQIHGTCKLTSTLGQGTVVEFVISLKQGLA